MRKPWVILVSMVTFFLIGIGIIIYLIYRSNYEELALSGDVTLRTVNYNIFGRWFGLTGYEGQSERLAGIAAAIAAHPKMGTEVDVITIEEAWCPDSQIITGSVVCDGNKSADGLVSSMAQYGWKYHTDVIDKPGVGPTKKQTGGGSMIFSKWPIEATHAYVYTSGSGQDKSAAKGAVYVRVTKTLPSGLKQVFNIIGTHLQAWSTPEGAKARHGQLSEIVNNFVPAIGITSTGTEPLIYQGDMNTDYVLYPEEVDSMLDTLQAVLPDTAPGATQIFSSDPSTNFLVGKDGAASQDGCLAAYAAQLGGGKGAVPSKPSAACQDIPMTTNSGKAFRPRFTTPDGKLNVGKNCEAYCPCCPHEMLDYILYSKEKKYLQPTSSNIEIIPLKSVKPLTYDWGWCDGGWCLVNKKESGTLTGSDLSDHYPVVANFTFKPITQTFVSPDGCKTDADCHVKGLYCECTGPGCTIGGKHVSDEGGSHSNKVNDNCHWRTSSRGTCFCRPGNE
jgi:hypothetical protein